MCTVNVEVPVSPAGTITGPQVKDAAAIAQVLFSFFGARVSIDQFQPALVGLSALVTPAASPFLVLNTVRVTSIGSPAPPGPRPPSSGCGCTGGSDTGRSRRSACFRVRRSSRRRCCRRCRWSSRLPPVADVVGEVMRTVNVDAVGVIPGGTAHRSAGEDARLILQLLPNPALGVDRPVEAGVRRQRVRDGHAQASPMPVL